MFSQIYKKLAISLFFILIPVMIFTFILNKTMPDTYYITSEDELKFSSSHGDFISFGFSASSNKSQLKLCNTIPIKNITIEKLDKDEVIVCGTPFGVKMFTDGVMVVDFSNIKSLSTDLCPASSAGICIGDIVCSINGKTVYTNEDIERYVQESNGNNMEIEILRNSESYTFYIKPIKSSDDNKYKIGIWVRDSSAGIGTMTFYDPSTMVFAGLGHAICDVDTGKVLPLSTGEIVPAAINSVKKGKSGTPGELEGIFLNSYPIGKLFKNSEMGLYGILNQDIDGIPFSIAPKQDIFEGEAKIITTIDGTNTNEYSISIEKISLIDGNSTKNMIIKVTDDDLIKTTGGIVQGMSGSPIIQNGKLVGAITHVFVNDPTKGYAIFAENMKNISSEIK